MRKLTLGGIGCLSALALYVTSGAQFVLGVSLLLLLCSAFGERWRLSRATVAAFALLCGVGSLVIQPTVPRAHGFLILPAFTFSVGLFSCLLTAVLVLRRPIGADRYFVLVSSLLTVLAAGNTTYALPYGYIVLLYTLAMLVYVRSEKLELRAGLLVPVGLVGLVAGLIAMGLSLTQPMVRGVMSSFQFWSASINFGDTAGIKPQGGAGGRKVLLRVFAENPENYLAARRYVHYRDNLWTASKGELAKPESLDQHAFREGYSLRGELGADWQPAAIDSIELTTLRPEALPLPLQARFVEVPLEKALLSPCGDLLVDKTGAGFRGSYRLARGSLSLEEDPRLLEECLQLEVDPYVSELAQSIAGEKDDKLKTLALVQFFHQNFEYGFGYPFDKSEDPVVSFLKERPPAHCEVYATCLALMARSVGVPARYVQGFLLRERNEWGEYWVSRERDAHAWVEVYLEGVGWVTVDGTPPQVSGPVDSESSWGEVMDLAKRFFQRLWATLARGPQALVEDLLKMLGEHPIGTVCGLLLMVLWGFRRRLRFGRKRRKLSSEPDSEPEEVLEMKRLFHRFEELIEQRKPSALTPLEWAESLGEAGEFLREYSRMRFSKPFPSRTDLDQLEVYLSELEEKVGGEM